MQMPFLNLASESSSEQQTSDQIRDQLIVQKSDKEHMFQIGKMLLVLMAAGLCFMLYIGAKDAWKRHVTPLYSRASNPKRKKSRARKAIR